MIPAGRSKIAWASTRYALSDTLTAIMQTNSVDEILKILARDARATPESIAKLTGQTPDEVREKIQAYETAGIIKCYRTVVDWEKAGLEQVIAFIEVRVTPARDIGFDGVAKRIARFPEVESVWLVSGGSDLRVVVEASSVRELGRFVAERLAPIDGVTGTVTHFLLRRYKEDQVMFVDQEEDNRLVVSP